MRMSSREPFPEQPFLFRERYDLTANDNSALHHRDLSVVNLVPPDDGLTKIAAKTERMGIAVAVAIVVSLFIGPVVFTCLMLGVWNAALDSDGDNHDRNVHDIGNPGGGFAREAEGRQPQHG